MNIENKVFKRFSVNYKKLIPYGFIKDNDNYLLEKDFLNNEFKAIITINSNGKVTGKVIENEIGDEYTLLRTEIVGEFVGKVREAYKEVLIDIRNNCFEANFFIFDQTNRINNYIKEKYHNDPEFLWESSPGAGVYRNPINNKWYGIIMNVNYSKLDSNKTGEVEVINIKLDEVEIKDLLNKNGFYKAYHMNKVSWISIILNDTLSDEVICSLIDKSYNIINEKEEWIVPANPKYYDVIKAFSESNEIIWKQSSDIHVNDIVYLYVAEPYSKIMYKCMAIEVNIPYDYQDDNLTIKHVMKIKLLEELSNKNYTFAYLNKIGIRAIRGPRKISREIRNKLM
jgi:predicted DNA-binding protein (MmcQ/YjbR family)